MVISIGKIATELKITTPDLIARINGRLMYERTKKLMKNITGDETLILDFRGIQVIDSSFVDEYVVRILADAKNSEAPFYVKLRNISKSTEMNIESVLQTYGGYASDRLAVLTEDICQSNNFFIGPLSGTERDMIHYLRLNKGGSVSDIAEFTGLPEGAVREMLVGLSASRLVKNDGGGFFSGI